MTVTLAAELLLLAAFSGGWLAAGYRGPEAPRPDDRHVLAVAIKAAAQVIVTRNLKDFPESDLGPWNVEAKSPDAFVLDQVHINVQVVAASVRQIADSRTNPPEAVEDVLQPLRGGGAKHPCKPRS